jgi:uncharacterized protein (TIRG00374 family)
MNNQKLLRFILNLSILIGLVIAGWKYLNVQQVLEALQVFNLGYLLPMLLLSIFYIYLKGYRFVMLMKPVSDLPAHVFLNGYVAGTAATLLPGGVAARAGLMLQAGVPISRSTPPVILSSILDQVVLVSAAVLAGLFYPQVRGPALWFLIIGTLLGLSLLIPALRIRFSSWIESLARRFNFENSWRNFLQSVHQVTRVRILLASLIVTYAGLLVSVLILHLTLLGFQQALSLPVLFLVYIVPSFLGRNLGAPGGVGVTEASMVGFMNLSVGMEPELALAISVVFRIVIVLFQAFLGAAIYFFVWQGGNFRQPAKKEVDHPSDTHL